MPSKNQLSFSVIEIIALRDKLLSAKIPTTVTLGSDEPENIGVGGSSVIDKNNHNVH